MNRKRFVNLFVSATVAASQMLSPLVTSAQQGAASGESPSPLGAVRARLPRIVERYHPNVAEDLTAGPTDSTDKTTPQTKRPTWVESAVRASITHLTAARDAQISGDTAKNLALFSASKDDAGNVDVRLSQRRDGIEVVSGQLIVRVNARGMVRMVSGRLYDTTGAESTPLIDEAEAVAAASAAARIEGASQAAPVVQFAILPRAVATGDERATGATLTYRVTLRSASAPGPVDVFVDAKDGSVVLSRNKFAAERGIAYTLYNGRVTIGTTPMSNNRYRLRDPERGNSETWDGGGKSDGSGTSFIDRGDDVWGNGTTNNRQTVGASAHFGVEEAWNFYGDRYGRIGADGNGTGITTITYYGSSLNNAFGGDNRISIGMGDGVQFSPLVAVDVVGHEFTHNVVEATAGLSTQYEGGAINESLCDIFGNAVEAYSGRAANYLVGEDCYTPATAGDGLRDMANPTIDHFSKLERLDAGEQPNDGNDNGYVHANSGIMSNAFYLVSEGGTNAVSGMSVPAIGRAAAEDIFYLALTDYMFPGTDYVRAANSTLGAASELYGYDSSVYRAVERAWHAVGVLQDETPPADTVGRKLLFYSQYDGSASVAEVNPDRTLASLNTYPGGSFAEWWWVVGDGTDIFYYNGDTGAAAIGNVDAAGNHITTKIWPANTFGKGWTSIVRHKGSLLFYNQYTGVAAVGRLTGPQGFTQYNAWTTFSRGWTTIASVQGRLMFYNRNTGATAVGDLEDVVSGPPGQFPTLVRIDYHDIRGMHLSAGWTTILDTGNGILFYNSDTGVYAVGDLETDGALTTRVPGTTPGGHPTWSYTNLGTNWTSIARLKETLLFYNFDDGSAMTARMRGTAGIEYEIDGEPLVPCQYFTLDRYFSQVVCTVDPTLPPG